MTRLYRGLANELFPFDEPLSNGERVFFRIFEAFIGAWTLQFLWTWAPSIQNIEAVVLPLGIANYVDVSVFFNHGLSYVVAGVATAALLLAYTHRTRWAYAVVLALFHLQYVSRYSLGEISHGSHFPGLAVLALALGCWLYAKQPEARIRFVFGFLFFIYGIGYSSAGVCKLVASGIGWPAGEHLALWVGERSVDVTSTFGQFELNSLQRLALRYPWIGTCALGFGLLAELAGMAMWIRRARPYVLTALIIMHLGVEFTLNIFFGHNIYILILLAYPWARVIDWLLARLPFGGPKSFTLSHPSG